LQNCLLIFFLRTPVAHRNRKGAAAALVAAPALRATRSSTEARNG
jgi:hypothetical protein